MKKREEEMAAVRTTIVGGRPPGCGRHDVAVPRGIEVLVKKASVDEAFRGKLLAERGAAAGAIGLELDPAESAMLGVIPEEQLAGIIRQTVVPAEQRRVFMGTVAAAMLAVIGVGLASCQQSDATGGQAGAPVQANNPQSLPQGEVIKGLRAASTPAETSTQTAPATGNTTPPNPPMVVFGLRREPPPATSTQPASPPSTAPVVDTQPRLLMSAGILILTAPPATSTQPATAPGDASPTPPANLPRPVAGLMAPRPPTTSTQPAPTTSMDPASVPTDATYIAPPAPPIVIAGLMAPRPPTTSTQPATDTKPAATDTAPATTRQFYGGSPGRRALA